MTDGPVTHCGSCGSAALTIVLDMGMQPLPQAIPGKDSSRRYPLRLVECQRCTLVQLDYIVPQTEVFPADYPYVTGNTKALRDHFDEQARTVAGMIGDNDLVVDIGANDGTMLAVLNQDFMRQDGSHLRPRVLGVEPTGQAKKCGDRGVPCWQNYFTSEVGNGIRALYGPAKVITTSNTFGHVPDPHDFLDGVTALLDEDGTFLIDNQDWFNVVEDLQIDTIYHEHLRYYSPASLSWLLAKHDLLVTSINRIGMHGGSFRAIARKQKPDLKGRAWHLTVRLHKLLDKASQDGPVYAITAPTRATPLVNYTKIGKFLTCACEVSNSEKIGGLIPGTGVPIVDEQALFDEQPPNALLLAWDLAGTLIPVLRKRGYTGNIIVPLPEPRIVDA